MYLVVYLALVVVNSFMLLSSSVHSAEKEQKWSQTEQVWYQNTVTVINAAVYCII